METIRILEGPWRSTSVARQHLALAALVCVNILAGCGAGDDGTSGGQVVEDGGLRIEGSDIRIPAVVDVGAFERRILGMPGYHLIVWQDGGASGSALFRTQVSDLEVLDALESIGAKPGNALGNDTWERRHDPESEAPDRVIAGPLVEILIEVPGHSPALRLEDVLEDPGGKGFEMRFGGHRANREAWGSGCVACLFSCPGSKVGNARYTVRDYVSGKTRFRVIPGSLPADGSPVTLILRSGVPRGR